MKQATRAQLAGLNRIFYRDHASAFSESRARPWRGWQRVIARLPERRPLRVLDVGCGNGRFGALLHDALGAGHLEYVGIDESAELLSVADARHGGRAMQFAAGDFLASTPGERLPPGPFDLVALFGVLHHVPGEDARRALLEACTARLDAGGLLALTFWRYDRDARFASRCIDAAALHPPIADDELEPGDRLLRFGHAHDAIRYCHFPSSGEQERLLEGLCARVVDRFDADGAGGQLNSYALLSR